MTSRKRRTQAGFTLMELMVVVAIIAMIAVFALPRLSKNVARTKLTDGINAISSAIAQVQATCATRGGSITSASNLFGSTPNGYDSTKATLVTANCPNVKVKLPATDTAVPDICAEISNGNVLFSFGKETSEIATKEDLPIPDTKLKTPASAFSGCS